MEFIVWVETRLAGKTLAVEEVARVDRCADGIAREDIGLSLAEFTILWPNISAYCHSTGSSIAEYAVELIDDSELLRRKCCCRGAT